MKPHRGFLSERFVDTLGGVREALCCRRLTDEREALCAGIATVHIASKFPIAIIHLKAFAKVVESLKQEMSWKVFDGRAKVILIFFSFVSVSGFKDGLLDKTGQTFAAI